MEKNVVEQIVIPEVPKVIPNEQLYVYVPLATLGTKGVASYDNTYFTVTNGHVSIKDGVFASGSAFESLRQTVVKNVEDISIAEYRITDLETGQGFLSNRIDVLRDTRVTQIYAYVDPSNYVFSIRLLNNDSTIIDQTSVDLPLESMVVNGAYDDTNQKIVLTLQNGNTIDIPVGDLVDGLISSTEKGQPNGVPTLGTDGKVPAEQLPDDIGGAPDLSDYVKSTDYATADKGGVVKVRGANTYGVRINENGLLFIDGADETAIEQKASDFLPITPAKNDHAVKVGVTTNTETLTDEEKKTACAWLGATKWYAHNITDGFGLKFQIITNKSTEIPRSDFGALIYSGDPNIRIATVNVFGSTLSTGITIKPIINAQLLQGLRLLYYDYVDNTATPKIYAIGAFTKYEIQEIKGV